MPTANEDHPPRRLHREVKRFRKWATPKQRQYLEWELDYRGWDALAQAFRDVIADSEPETWDDEVVGLMLYTLARNNEYTWLKRDLVKNPRHLVVLARAGLPSPETNARWQLAEALGYAGEPVESIALHERYFEDADEYVSRLALLGLGRRNYAHLERLALRAWDRGDEWQRIGALWALAQVESPRLGPLLDAAEADGRERLVDHAGRIRAGERQA